MICGSGGSKSRLAKAAVAEPAGQMRDEQVHVVVARSTFPSQNAQNTSASAAFGSCEFQKVHAVAARSTFRSQNVQSAPCTDRFWTFGSRFAWQAQGIVHRQNVRVLWYSKNDGRRGTFEDNLQRCIFRGTTRRNTRDIFIGAVRRSGWGFPERGCILEHQIFRFAEMILRDRCNTLYDLASLFRGRRNTCDRWTGKMAKRIGTRLSALHPTFHF